MNHDSLRRLPQMLRGFGLLLSALIPTAADNNVSGFPNC